MRILWISPNGGKYKHNMLKGTGGWIGALQEDLLVKSSDLKLALAFESSDSEPVSEGNVTYYPICTKNKGKFLRYWKMIFSNEKKRETILKDRIIEIISEFKPDVVHVWGIENTYAAVIPYINCPFVVHIQGLLSLYKYIYMPPAFSISDIKSIDSWLDPKTWGMKLLHFSQMDIYENILYRANREMRVSKYVKNWIGRTEWDYHASQMLSPNSNYYHCEEIMRDDFDNGKWQFHYDDNVIRIQSSISETWYKGIDVILKTASILKEQNVKIEWKVYGIERNRKLVDYMSRRLSISPDEVGVIFMGRVSGKIIRDGLLSCDVYVHPSYIENSSNAIAEAMMLGVPTIAQYVGGNPTMLKDNSGILVPAGAPVDLAFAIKQAKEKNLMSNYSERALEVAKNRQDKDKTISNLISIYRTISEQTC